MTTSGLSELEAKSLYGPPAHVRAAESRPLSERLFRQGLANTNTGI